MNRPVKKSRDREKVSLLEAVNWIGFGDFEGPSPQSGPDLVEYIPFPDAEADARILATKEIFSALAAGELEAQGYLSIKPLDGRTPEAGLHNWVRRIYIEHSSDRSSIPSIFWKAEGIDWRANVAKSYDREYAGIVLNRDDVVNLWTFSSEAGTQRSLRKATTAGRPTQYDQTEFLALCVLEASRESLPDHQSDFISRMEQLIAVVWGDDGVPSQTWLKEKVQRIYGMKEKYLAGRQLINPPSNSRPT